MRFDSQRLLLNGVSNPALDFSLDLLFSRGDILTAIVKEEREKALCLVNLDNTTAHLSFLLTSNLQSKVSLFLLDELCKSCGHKGIRHLLMDVTEEHDVNELLRQVGFSSYGSQKIWKIRHVLQGCVSSDLIWHLVRKDDFHTIQSLYNRLLPPIEKALQPWQSQRDKFHYLEQDNSIVGVARVRKHLNRIVVWPLFDPIQIEETQAVLLSLIARWINAHYSVYVAIRSHQERLEEVLERIGKQALPRQVLMVKHLVEFQPINLPVVNQSINNKRRPEPSTPFVHSKTQDRP